MEGSSDEIRKWIFLLLRVVHSNSNGMRSTYGIKVHYNLFAVQSSQCSMKLLNNDLMRVVVASQNTLQFVYIYLMESLMAKFDCSIE